MSPAISTTAGHLIGRLDKLEKEISRLKRNESRGWEIQYVVPAGGVASYPIPTIPQYVRHIRFLIQARGDVAAFTGHGTSPRTLSFKVGVSPSRTQIGQVLELVRSISFTGEDSIAGVTISATAPSVTTMTQDQASGSNSGQVVQ